MRWSCAMFAVVLLFSSESLGQPGTTPIDPTIQWRLTGFSFYTGTGTALSAAGDFNGDGYGDFVVGAPSIDDDNDGGEARMYYGSATGVVSRYAWGAYEQQVDAWEGFSVTCAGDINSDGYDDVAIGAPRFGLNEVREGRVRVFFGRRTRGTGEPWRSLGGTGGARLGQAVCGVGDVTGDGYDDLAVGAPGRFDGTGLGTIYLLSGGRGVPTVFSWNFKASEIGSELGAVIAGCGDVDGDGYNDVIVSAPGYRVDGERVGAAYVFFGEPGGLGLAPGITVVGYRKNGDFGRTLALADVNGDGFSDVMVGAPLHRDGSDPEVGRVFVYYSMGQGRVLSDPVILGIGTEQFGHSISSLGDIDGDGREDIAIGNFLNYTTPQREVAYIFLGKSEGLQGAPEQTLFRFNSEDRFAAVVSGMGDVNGDGVNDLMVGNPLTSDAGRGEVYVFHGNRIADRLAKAPVRTWGSESDDDDFGRRTLNAGDVDGDGWDDLLVTAPLDDSAAEDAGAAFVYRGGPGGWAESPQWTLVGRDVGEWFGESAAALGDVNGDGYADVAVGATHASGRVSDEGAVFVYYGGENGPSPDSMFTAWGGQRAAAMGSDVSWAGDVNGDGLSDVLVGSAGFDGVQPDEGRITVYYGNPHRLSATNAWVASGGRPGAALGYAVSFAGDLNRDGYSDIVAAAPFHDGGGIDAGALFVYHGAASGLPEEPSAVIFAGRAGARLGVSLACAGDVNGDGFSDIIAGTGNRGPLMTDLGTVFSYHGGPSGVSLVPDWSASGQITDGAFGDAVAGIGDVDVDGYSDVAIGDPLHDGDWYDMGRVSVYYGDATGLSSEPFVEFLGTVPRGRLGRAVGSAGDINGDGGFDLLCAAQSGEGVSLFTTSGAPGARVQRHVIREGMAGSVGPFGWSGRQGILEVRVAFSPPPGATRAGFECQTRLADGTWGTPDATVYVDATLVPAQRRPGELVMFELGVPQLGANELYQWRVRARSSNPLRRTSPWAYHASDINGGVTVRIGEAPDIPPPPDDPPPPRATPRFVVNEPYPNPFNPAVTVGLSLDRRSQVSARVYDVRGRLVMTLLNQVMDEGPQELRWWGYDRSGAPAASGVYFMRIRAGSREVVRRLVLIR